MFFQERRFLLGCKVYCRSCGYHRRALTTAAHLSKSTVWQDRYTSSIVSGITDEMSRWWGDDDEDLPAKRSANAYKKKARLTIERECCIFVPAEQG
jgi:hypothetical protein